MLKDSKNILIVGCDGCAAMYQAGGLRQTELMSRLLRIARKSTEIKAETMTVLRQCDRQIAINSITPLIKDYDTILSMACGAGVQTLADIFEDKMTVAANDTMFIGMQDFEAQNFQELCSACGECVLSETAGVCPITRCPKHLLNGPCGGFAKGKCEVGEGKRDCAWVQIFDRLKARGRLDLFLKFRPPKDYRVSQPPREIGG